MFFVENVVKSLVRDVSASLDSPVFESVEKSSSSASSSQDSVVDLTVLRPPSNRRGSEKRRQYTTLFKAKVIEYIEMNSPDATQEKAADLFSVPTSNVSKWWKNKSAIIREAADNKRKTLMRRSTKYVNLYAELLTEVKQARSKGYLVNFNWFWTKAGKIYRKQIGNPDAPVRKHVITMFLRRFNVRMRARQRNRTFAKEHYRGDLMKWHGLT